MGQHLKKTAAVVGFAALFSAAACSGSDESASNSNETAPVSSEASTTAMPDVLGQTLDVALSDIKRAGVEDEVEVLGGGTFGVVVESNWQVCEQLPAAGQELTEAPRLTVDRSCPDVAAEPEVTEPEVTEPEVTEPEVTEPEVTEPEVTEPEPADTEPSPASTDPETDASSEQPSEQVAYTYEGPQYEIVSTDATGIGLEQFWVLTDKLDYSTDSYKDQVKLIIADMAREQGTASIIVEVVTDIEIALLESSSTTAAFYAEVGDDYVNNVVVPKEATDWIASYTGGYDYNTSVPSDAEDAFEVIWFIGGDNIEFETWKPE
jgi:hypothetical protein